MEKSLYGGEEVVIFDDAAEALHHLDMYPSILTLLWARCAMDVYRL
jgi:hypothetical protein